MENTTIEPAYKPRHEIVWYQISDKLFSMVLPGLFKQHTVHEGFGKCHLGLRVRSEVQEQLGNVRRGPGVVKRSTTSMISSCYRRPGSKQETASLELTQNRERVRYGSE